MTTDKLYECEQCKRQLPEESFCDACTNCLECCPYGGDYDECSEAENARRRMLMHNLPQICEDLEKMVTNKKQQRDN